jgi:hypothetical protein
MLVFIDFEASSLADRSYPIEVAWVFEDGTNEAFLIHPAAGWDDWDPAAEAIHHITRAELGERGTSHEVVAHRMVKALDGHELFASAPSWDGKWLSALLRAAGLPRHTLRLRDTDDALEETARAVLGAALPPADLPAALGLVLGEIPQPDATPAHRALPDAQAEWRRWWALRDRAQAVAATWQAAPDTAAEG